MSLFSKLLAIDFSFMFIAMILFVAFGQITVRKLRKNPKTKEALGIELMSGWDILNVAQALALPRRWRKKVENKPLSFMLADSQVLYGHTTKFDRVLARVFWWIYIGSVVSGLILIVLDSWGAFGD